MTTMIYFLCQINGPLFLIGTLDQIGPERRRIKAGGALPSALYTNHHIDNINNNEDYYHDNIFNKMNAVSKVIGNEEDAQRWREAAGPGGWMPGSLWVKPGPWLLKQLGDNWRRCSPQECKLLGVKNQPEPKPVPEVSLGLGSRLARRRVEARG